MCHSPLIEGSEKVADDSVLPLIDFFVTNSSFFLKQCAAILLFASCWLVSRWRYIGHAASLI
jgi:hypothetical protein